MKIKVKVPKVRNPLTVAANLRHAGSHEKTQRTKRQQAARALRTELARMPQA